MLSRIKKAVGHAVASVEDAVGASDADPAVGHVFEVERYTVEVEKLLAAGGFANVYLARDVHSEKRYALKKILVQVNDREEQRLTKQEINIMKKFKSSKNIVTLFASTSRPNAQGNFTEFLLLMELCPDGHLIDWMQHRMSRRPTEIEVLEIFGQVCAGLCPLHASDPPIIHRDIKPENVLLVNGSYKLCDFGSCTTNSFVPGEDGRAIVDVEMEIQAKTTPSYRPPEMVDLYQRRRICEKADVWAMGCLLYKLVFFDDAFGEGGAMAILGGRYKTPACAAHTERISGLLSAMLEIDPEKRVNIFQVTKRVYDILGKPPPVDLPANVRPLRPTRSSSSSSLSPDGGGARRQAPQPAAHKGGGGAGFADFSQVSAQAHPQSAGAGFADFSAVAEKSSGGGGGGFADFGQIGAPRQHPHPTHSVSLPSKMQTAPPGFSAAFADFCKVNDASAAKPAPAAGSTPNPFLAKPAAGGGGLAAPQRASPPVSPNPFVAAAAAPAASAAANPFVAAAAVPRTEPANPFLAAQSASGDGNGSAPTRTVSNPFKAGAEASAVASTERPPSSAAAATKANPFAAIAAQDGSAPAPQPASNPFTAHTML